jgi:hypothetical protein
VKLSCATFSGPTAFSFQFIYMGARLEKRRIPPYLSCGNADT